MKVFFDTEFTGLRQDTTLISLGAVSEEGHTFYAEFTDYNVDQIEEQENNGDYFITENVIKHLEWHGINEQSNSIINIGHHWRCKGNKQYVAANFIEWTYRFPEPINMWSDCLAYDWVLFCNMFNNKLPVNINYIPFDICTMFELKDIDPDISREEFAEIQDIAYGEDNFMEIRKHNALFDAKVIKKCYDKLVKL